MDHLEMLSIIRAAGYIWDMWLLPDGRTNCAIHMHETFDDMVYLRTCAEAQGQEPPEAISTAYREWLKKEKPGKIEEPQTQIASQWISDHLPEEGELVQIGDSVGYWHWDSAGDYSNREYRQWYKLIEDRMEPLDGDNYPDRWRPLAQEPKD